MGDTGLARYPCGVGRGVVPTDADDGHVLCASRNGDAGAGAFVDTARVFGDRDLPFHDEEIGGKAQFAERSFDRPAVP